LPSGITCGISRGMGKDVRENRLRRMAQRQGLRVIKSRRRDPYARDYGTYLLVDARENWNVGGGARGPELTIDELEDHLTGEEPNATRGRRINGMTNDEPAPDEMMKRLEYERTVSEAHARALEWAEEPSLPSFAELRRYRLRAAELHWMVAAGHPGSRRDADLILHELEEFIAPYERELGSISNADEGVVRRFVLAFAGAEILMSAVEFDDQFAEARRQASAETLERLDNLRRSIAAGPDDAEDSAPRAEGSGRSSALGL